MPVLYHCCDTVSKDFRRTSLASQAYKTKPHINRIELGDFECESLAFLVRYGTHHRPSFCGTVVQFLKFSCKLISKSWEMYIDLNTTLMLEIELAVISKYLAPLIWQLAGLPALWELSVAWRMAASELSTATCKIIGQGSDCR